MYIFNLFDDSPVKAAAADALKTKGVKYKILKRRKAIQKCVNGGVFNVPLSEITPVTVQLRQGQIQADIPLFLFDAVHIIEKNIHIEGIFRKGGSASKQRELKQLINSGLPLPDECHVVDVCNLVKLFLRELPEPLIPHSYHETMLSCLVLTGEQEQHAALLLACLLLPRHYITVLAYLLEFLYRVALNSTSNKMDAKNLAIVITPSLMHIDEKSKLGINFGLSHHISLVEMLIKCSPSLGLVPSYIIEAANQRKGRKRSASITRVFTGIRKIVGRGSTPPRETDDAVTDVEPMPGQKRRSQEILPPAVTVKRRREVANITPRMCRMRVYSAGSVPQPEEVPSEQPQLPRSGDKSKTVQVKKGRRRPGLKASKSSSSLLGNKKKSLERKLSSITWGRRRSSMKSTSPLPTQEEVVTIPRKQYEDILTRVTCMEKILQMKSNGNSSTEPEQLAKKLEQDLKLEASESEETPIKASPSSPASVVHAAYQMTLEQSETLTPIPRKDIRWSSESRVARSPSQRKIASIRRRSKELMRNNSTASKSIKKAPNTPRNPRSRSLLLDESDVNWQPAASVILPPSAQMARLRAESPKKRDSINCLRRNNIGMVHAKAKFFDSLNYSTEGDLDKSGSHSQSVERRLKSIQTEMREARSLRQLKENRQPVIKVPLCANTTNTLRTPRSCTRPATRIRATPLKALPDTLATPINSVRRSPRILARTVAFSCGTP